MPGRPTTLSLLDHDRRIVAGVLAVAVVLAAAFILRGGGTGMSTLQMTDDGGPLGVLLSGLQETIRPAAWSMGYAAVIFFMWWMMMVAMMLPSAAPVILLHGALFPATGVRTSLAFLAGYLAAWGGFSAVATLLQGGLAAAGLISPMYMTLATPFLGAALLVGAGLYQLTPAKAACLASCRGPVEVLTRHRGAGAAAAFRTGAGHGATCLGCCWALMALLFVGGVMNLWWIVGLTLYVAAEKLAPWGPRLARPFGLALVAAGLALLAAALRGA